MGSPAEKMGIEPGNVVVKVGMIDGSDQNLYTIRKTLQGEAETNIPLTVERKGSIVETQIILGDY